jgi:hypothetical protein
MKRKAEDIALTASRFSALVGVDRNEILNRLEEAKAEPVGRKNGGNTYSLRDLFHAAIGGDIQEQRLRKLRAEADHLELSLRTKRRELVPVSESVETVVQCAWDTPLIASGIIEPIMSETLVPWRNGYEAAKTAKYDARKLSRG